MAGTTPKKTKVKICGIRTPDAMTAALEHGADFVGLNFIPTSPRYVEIEVAAYLTQYVPDHVQVVGLFADAPTDTIRQVLENVRIDLIQLHGQETPEVCEAISARFQKPVIKALSAAEIKKVQKYEAVCDWLIIDAPPPIDASYKGGHGQAFDWSLLQHFKPATPWMLAGGLTPDNVAAAIETLRPDAVDVSSGVEIAKGIKDPGKIRAFINAVKNT